MRGSASTLDTTRLLREPEWRARRRHRLIMSLLGLILVAVVIFASVFHATAQDAPTTPQGEPAGSSLTDARDETQAECFLKRRPGGLGRLQRQWGQRRWIQKLQGLVDDAVRGTSWTSGTVLAIAFHESSWRPRAMGSRGEHGLMQIHPDRLRVAGLEPGQNSLDPATNLRLGVTTLDACKRMCGDQRHDILMCYAAGACSHRSTQVQSIVRVMVNWTLEADACRNE